MTNLKTFVHLGTVLKWLPYKILKILLGNIRRNKIKCLGILLTVTKTKCLRIRESLKLLIVVRFDV